MSTAWLDSRFAEDPEPVRTAQFRQRHGGVLPSVTKLLLEVGEVRFNKGLTTRDHAVGEVADPAAQAFGQGEFAVLFVNYRLSGWQVKSRMIGIGFHTPVQNLTCPSS